MKITKLAQYEYEFENEGRNPLEQFEERKQFESEYDLKEEEIGKKSPSHSAIVLGKAMKAVGDIINSSYVSSGAVGWVKNEDGIIYEVLVSPAAYGVYFNYFNELNNRKINPETVETEETLP